MKKKALLVLFALISGFSAVAWCQRDVVVRPVESDEILVNPGMGFNISQHISHRLDDSGRHRIDERQLGPDQYPECSLAYLRFHWRHLESERERFNWYIIDDALALARSRNQTLMMRIVPYGNTSDTDIPDWLRSEIGPSGELPHSFWRVDHEDPRYSAALSAMAEAVGRRYDGHPDLEFVDIGIVGFWGEGAGSELLSQPTREKLVNAYLDAFHKTPLVMLLTDARTNSYGVSRLNVGWRGDCLGDLGGFSASWCHMRKGYPGWFRESHLDEVWKRAPIAWYWSVSPLSAPKNTRWRGPSSTQDAQSV